MSDNADRLIVVPASHMGEIDAALRVYSPDGETAAMMLSVGTEIIARGETFRRAAMSPHTWLDAPEEEIVATFGAFLSHAVESSEEEDARMGWPILTDRASDWTDALAIAGDGF